MDIKNNKNLVLKMIITVLFVIYMIGLFKIILFKTVSIQQLFGTYTKRRSLNLIPFKTITEYIVDYKQLGIFNGVSNVMGNIIVFIPLGYMVPMIFKKFSKLNKVFMVSAMLSLFFEVSQYIFGIGSTDIDDIILNAFGGVIGYVLFVYLKKFFTKKNVQYISVIAVTVMFLVSSSIVAVEEYGVLLHIR